MGHKLNKNKPFLSFGCNKIKCRFPTDPVVLGMDGVYSRIGVSEPVKRTKSLLNVELMDEKKSPKLSVHLVLHSVVHVH